MIRESENLLRVRFIDDLREIGRLIEDCVFTIVISLTNTQTIC